MTNTITIPAAIDLHVHLREPSTNKAETIKSGTKAAVLGGCALVCDMPNNPGSPTWSFAALQDKQERIQKSAYIPVAVYAGSQPESNNLDELEQMAEQTIGLKLYGAPTTGNDRDYTSADFRDIVAKWHRVAPDKPIMLHSGKGNLAEFIELIAKKHHHHLHVCHLSSVRDAKLAVRAKTRGLPVSSGVCPHHLLMNFSDTLSQGWFARMQPPLLSEIDAEILFKMFAKGQIDVIESDHAPHTTEVKWAAEAENPNSIHDPQHRTCFGVPGVEFMVPLLLYQVGRGRLSLERLIDATSTQPAKIIGVKLSPKTKVTWELKPYRIGDAKSPLSGSGWTPYAGYIAGGRVKKMTINGRIVALDGRMLKTPTAATRGAII